MAVFSPLTVVLAVLRTEEPQRLPRFYTTAIHGALGRAVYRLVCAFRDRDTCDGCPLIGRCAYPALFETRGVADPVLQAGGIRDMAPRPLVLAPHPGWNEHTARGRTCVPGDEIPVRLTLIGPAGNDLALLRVALERMAERGVGIRLDDRDGPPQRARLALVRLERSEYRPEDAHPVEEVTLEFVTPLRLTVRGRITNRPTPEAVVGALARRVNAFARLAGNSIDVVDEVEVRNAGRTISAEAMRLRRVMVRRWSARQRRRLELPGIMGAVRWKGPALQVLWSLLRWGEIAQVGKATSLGFGRYCICEA